ncbi:MAG: LamG-like jellyroll fold domain-containing protein [Bacteroidota bacterium]
MKKVIFFGCLWCLTFLVQTSFGQDSLLLYLKFDRDLTDLSPNGFDGSPLIPLDYPSGYCDEAIKIGDNTTDGITINGEVFDRLRDFTISVRVRIDDLNSNNTLISCSNLQVADELVLSYNAVDDDLDDGVHLIIRDDRHIFQRDFILGDMQWHHVAVTRQEDIATLYIDGNQIGDPLTVSDRVLAVAFNGFIIGQDQDCLTGCFEPDQSWAGDVDELQVFSKALSRAEILQLDCLRSSTNDIGLPFSYNLQPNPFTAQFSALLPPLAEVSYELWSAQGQLIEQGQLRGSSQQQISVGEQPAGIYYLRLTDRKSQKTATHKMVKLNN